MVRVLQSVALLALLALPALSAERYSPPDTNLPVERGKSAVGLSYLFNVDYVHAGQRGVTGIAYIAIHQPSHGVPKRPVDLVAGSYFHYRYRHLGLFPSDTHQYGQWHSIPMFHRDEPDLLYTYGEIPIPDYPCDLEFFISATYSMPYYQYVDYSGLNLGVPGYTEAGFTVATNRMDCPPGIVLPTGGSDFFIRVREFRSGVHAMRLAE